MHCTPQSGLQLGAAGAQSCVKTEQLTIAEVVEAGTWTAEARLVLLNNCYSFLEGAKKLMRLAKTMGPPSTYYWFDSHDANSVRWIATVQLHSYAGQGKDLILTGPVAAQEQFL